jgi:DNA replication protein DnaC
LNAPRRQDLKKTDCQECDGLGIYYDAQIKAGRYGRLRLCRCVEEQCGCSGESPYQHWDEEGQRHWCACRPFRRRMAETNRLFKDADIPEKYKWKFIGDFGRTAPDGTVLPYADEVLRTVYTIVDSEVDSEPKRGFLLHGNPGTGKTLLGAIMINELILRWAKPGRFLNMSRNYFQRLRDTYSEDSNDYGRTLQIVDELCNMPFLMLDDFGVQRGTDWEMEMLYELVDARYADERFTIITTNQDLDEIRKMSDGRIYSRLIEMCYLIPMQGVDYRQHLQTIR